MPVMLPSAFWRRFAVSFVPGFNAEMSSGLMIVISIMMVNRFVDRGKWVKKGLWVVHVLGMPLLVGAMAWYVHGLSVGDR